MSTHKCSFTRNLITLALFPFCASAASPWVVENGESLTVTSDYFSEEKNDYPLRAKGENSSMTVHPGLIFISKNAHVAHVTDKATLDLRQASLEVHGDSGHGIYASDSKVTVSSGVIATAGSGNYGIYAEKGGDVTLHGAQLNINGDMSTALYATDGATLSADSIQINNKGNVGRGIFLWGGASAHLNDVQIELGHANANHSLMSRNSTMVGNNVTILSSAKSYAAVLLHQDDGAQSSLRLENSKVSSDGAAFLVMGGDLTLNNVAIDTKNIAGYGLDINHNSDTHMTGGSIYTEGYLADAVWLAGKDTNLTADGVVMNTQGEQAKALNAQYGSAFISNSSLQTSGTRAHGIYTENSVEGENLNITTTGVNANGISVARQEGRTGKVNIRNATISTLGDGSIGILTMPFTTAYGEGLDIQTHGTRAHALALYHGKLELRNSEIATYGQAAAALYAFSSDPVVPHSALLDNVILSSEKDAGIRAFGASQLNLALQNGTVVKGGNGQALVAQAEIDNSDPAGPILVPSSVALSATDGVQLLGDIITDSAINRIDVALAGASLLSGRTQNVNQLALDSSSVWLMSGDSSLKTLRQDGQVVYGREGEFKTLQVTGNLSGKGRFVLNAELNGDNSPADRLLIAGKAEGNFTVAINNKEGGGALTDKGIPVIKVAGDAQSATFTQANEVVAGNYEYFLNNVDEGAWYLQSAYRSRPDDDREEEESQPEPKTYRPETAGYVMASYLNVAYGFNAIGSYHQRLGAYRDDRAAWGRIYARHDRYGAGRFGYSTNSSFMQLGGDLLHHPLADGWNIKAGPLLTLGEQSVSNRDYARRARPELSVNTGKTRTKAYGVGGYFTTWHDDGSYLDIVGQLTRYSNHFSSLTATKQDSYGVALSAEVGKPLALGYGLKLEPQAQLMAQLLNVSQTEAGGVKLNDQNIRVGQARGGLRLFYEGDAVQPYLTLDIVRQLGRTPGVIMNREALTPDVEKTTGQAGIGISGKLNQTLNLYAEAQYAHSFGQVIEGYSGHLGLKYQF